MSEIKINLLNQCLNLFLKYGIRAMSNEKLTKELGISTKTLYKYFKNKEDLLEQALLLFHQQQYELLRALPKEENSAIDFYQIWNRAVDTEYYVNKSFFQELSYYYPTLAQKTEKSISKKFEGILQGLIKQGMEKGHFKKDISLNVALESIYLLYSGLVRSDKFKKINLKPQEAFENTLGCFIRGMCSKNTIDELDAFLLNSNNK